MRHRCKHEVTAPFLFTTPTGELVELSRADVAAAFLPTPQTDSQESITTPIVETAPFNVLPRRLIASIDGSQDVEPAGAALQPDPDTPPSSRRNKSCSGSSPLIEIVTPRELLQKRTVASLAEKTRESTEESPQASEEGSSGNLRSDILKVSMVYDEHGELVSARDAHRQLDPAELGITQLLWLIKKAYRHEVREKLGDVIVQALQDRGSCFAASAGIGPMKGELSLWVLRKLPEPKPTGVNASVEVCKYPARVLDIGCGDGDWCFKVKLANPDWIVEGVDDTDHWLCANKDILIEDFMEPVQSNEEPNDNCSGRDRARHERPEFTVRNINNLFAHPRPMPHNWYGIIHGRDIFDRVESYKSFLEDVRLLLQPGGVVEFVEIDPRPRTVSVQATDQSGDRKSQSCIDWTDKIADRFKDVRDQELATTVPGWNARVEERLKANLRPRDGVAAPQLKAWLEGAGFWDVSQTVIQIPVGGDNRSGKLLKEFLLYQIELENEIPKLRQELPEAEVDEFEHGRLYLDLHIITGRKPRDPRPGDLLSDGTRQEVTNSIHDSMARLTAVKNSEWERYDLDRKLPTILENSKAS